jgi:putative lipase involved disintegration of autophagic bodies
MMNQKYPDADFVITGHSLGAALSVFAALDID